MDRHDKKHQPVARRAVTLIEVLIAIAIVAMLVALGVGAIQKVRAAAANAKEKKRCQDPFSGRWLIFDNSVF